MKTASFFNNRIRLILLGTIVLLGILLCIFARSDTGSKPEITCTEGNLKVSVDASDRELLSGMIATDKEDGDITDKIIIESYSDFVSKGVRSVKYAVMDSDLNVSKFEREIEYTDYKAPEFRLKYNPVVGMGADSDMLGYLKAKDRIDGDISGKIRLISTNVDNEKAGMYTTKCAVSNSAGDVSELEIPVTISDTFAGESPVELSQYITYSAEESIDGYRKYIKMSPAPVELKMHGNTEKKGCCYVDYMIGGVVYARLIVVIL